MSTTFVKTPTSVCGLGIGRVDITPPVGVYHRFWGAASHDQATGVHRPLLATVMLLQSPDDTTGAGQWALIAIDHCLFRPADMDRLLDETAAAFGMHREQILFTFSHTHSGGHICRERADLPGGDKIGPYLDELPHRLLEAFSAAQATLEPVTLTYGSITCNMGHQRDYWDEQSDQYVCGFNPDDSTELPLTVVRVSSEAGELVGTIVNYPCHPTTLAWENTLISPDYVGALRETVEQATGAPCVFLLAPCGDIGPAHGFVGDPAVADRNGRQVGYAALSALAGLPSPGVDFHYRGPVISGATIGAWEYRPQSDARAGAARRFRARAWEVPLNYLPGLPTVEDAEAKLARYIAEEQAARQQGNEQQARDARAMAERQRRLLERTRPLPPKQYPFTLRMWQLGDAFWIAVEGEPYHALQQQLQARFPERPLIFLELANGSRCSYLPTREAYGKKKLYQVEVALLEAGSLERLIEELAAQVQSWLDDSSAAAPSRDSAASELVN